MMTEAPTSKRRSSHQTQWAAQFAVASELCKRGYEVALTMGNHPTKDIMVSSPSGTSFGIDVKGLYKRNFWAVRKKPERGDIFYVFAFVPNEASNRYFVLSQAEVNLGIDKEFAKARNAAIVKGLEATWVEKFPGIAWAYAEAFEDGWHRLPE
jgi:hypothetical protein